MNEVIMLRGAEPREILQTIIKEKTPAIMSYLVRGKWYVAKILLTELGANILLVQVVPGRKRRPINIRVDQPVGVSLKYRYGKFIFDTTVIGLEPPPDSTDSETPDNNPQNENTTIILAMPERIEIVQRRSYFRVNVPKTLKVNVMLWRRRRRTDLSPPQESKDAHPDGWQDALTHYLQGRLVDISAGGAQIAVDTSQEPDLKKGQFIGLRFTPMPYEMPLMLNAQIRNILPTADGKSICLGLQIVGLEASPEGRSVLKRLCSVVEQYYQINQSSAKQQDMQPGATFYNTSQSRNSTAQ